jgi:hypothetical protein
MSASRPLVGGLELGGTKGICMIAAAPDDIRGLGALALTGHAYSNAR